MPEGLSPFKKFIVKIFARGQKLGMLRRTRYNRIDAALI